MAYRIDPPFDHDLLGVQDFPSADNLLGDFDVTLADYAEAMVAADAAALAPQPSHRTYYADGRQDDRYIAYDAPATLDIGAVDPLNARSWHRIPPLTDMQPELPTFGASTALYNLGQYGHDPQPGMPPEICMPTGNMQTQSGWPRQDYRFDEALCAFDQGDSYTLLNSAAASAPWNDAFQVPSQASTCASTISLMAEYGVLPPPGGQGGLYTNGQPVASSTPSYGMFSRDTLGHICADVESSKIGNDFANVSPLATSPVLPSVPTLKSNSDLDKMSNAVARRAPGPCDESRRQLNRQLLETLSMKDCMDACALNTCIGSSFPADNSASGFDYKGRCLAMRTQYDWHLGSGTSPDTNNSATSDHTALQYLEGLVKLSDLWDVIKKLPQHQKRHVTAWADKAARRIQEGSCTGRERRLLSDVSAAAQRTRSLWQQDKIPRFRDRRLQRTPVAHIFGDSLGPRSEDASRLLQEWFPLSSFPRSRFGTRKGDLTGKTGNAKVFSRTRHADFRKSDSLATVPTHTAKEGRVSQSGLRTHDTGGAIASASTDTDGMDKLDCLNVTALNNALSTGFMREGRSTMHDWQDWKLFQPAYTRFLDHLENHPRGAEIAASESARRLGLLRELSDISYVARKLQNPGRDKCKQWTIDLADRLNDPARSLSTLEIDRLRAVSHAAIKTREVCETDMMTTRKPNGEFDKRAVKKVFEEQCQRSSERAASAFQGWYRNFRGSAASSDRNGM